jgi:hypothetical protein
MEKFVVVLKNFVECTEEAREFSSYEAACDYSRQLESELCAYWEKGVDYEIEIKF